MKKTVLAIVLALSSAAALSSEVGAQNPQFANPAISTLEVAIAETGTSTSWAVQSEKIEVTAHQLAEHKNRVSVFESTMNSRLEAAIEQKLNANLRY